MAKADTRITDNNSPLYFSKRELKIVAQLSGGVERGGGGGGGGWRGRLSTDVRAEWPPFQRCQVYDWSPFFNKKYTTDPIFLDLYVKVIISRYVQSAGMAVNSGQT